MKENKIRAELDDRPESIGKKIRDAENQKVNIIITVGEKEIKNKTLAVRQEGKVKFGVNPEKFIEEVTKKIQERC